MATALPARDGLPHLRSVSIGGILQAEFVACESVNYIAWSQPPGDDIVH